MVWMGADPEFVVIDQAGNPQPAHVAGIQSQEEMRKAKSEAWPGALQVFRDGYGAEFNPRASNCIGLILTNLARILRGAEERLPGGWGLRAPAAVLVDHIQVMRDAPADVQQVGCNPSYNAYGAWGDAQSAQWLPQINPERMFSGHLHFSGLVNEYSCNTDTHNPAAVVERLRLLDLLVGVPMTYIFQDEKEVFIRRQFYGLAGEYRLPKYQYDAAGMEWRTPDATIWRHPAIAALIMGMAREVVRKPGVARQRVEKHFGQKLEDLGGRVQVAINKGEGLKELLMPEYFTALAQHKSGFAAPYARIDAKTLITLRDLRAEFFGPELAPLGTNFFSEYPDGREKAAAVTKYDIGVDHSPWHPTWPQYPLMMPSWKKYFNNCRVA